MHGQLCCQCGTSRPIQKLARRWSGVPSGHYFGSAAQINLILKYHAIKKILNTLNITKFMKNTKIPYITTIILLLK